MFDRFFFFKFRVGSFVINVFARFWAWQLKRLSIWLHVMLGGKELSTISESVSLSTVLRHRWLLITTCEDDSSSLFGRMMCAVSSLYGNRRRFERWMKSENSTRRFECVETLFTTEKYSIARAGWSFIRGWGPLAGNQRKLLLVDVCSNGMVSWFRNRMDVVGRWCVSADD